MKSVEIKFNEALAAIDKAGKRKQFDEKAKTCTTIEGKLNAAEAVLKDAGVVRESRPVRKNNGAGDNYSEGNPFRPAEEFRESSNNFSPGYMKENANPCAKGDKVMFDWMLKVGKITEADYRKLTGQKPAEYDRLTEQQRKEFDFARAVGISEADCLKLAKMAGNTFREVSRR
jgi:hypothetical protein